MIGDDDRAQSIQVGAVLLFGALIIALSAYQAFVVPQQNEKVEFTHNQEVQNQLADLRNAVVSVPGDSTTQSVSVTLGTSYPERLVALNPGPPSGALRTQGTTDPAINLSIDNATAVTESDDVADLWNGTRLNYSTGALVYTPNYNVYGNAPTTYYENSVLFNQFDSGEVTLTDQRLVDGNTISLVALNGSIDRTQQGATSVDVEPLSASTTTVTVQNESLTDPLTLRVPTRISVDTWENDLLANEDHVADVSLASDLPGSELQLVAIELDPRETYRLQMAKAGVGSATGGESRAYVTDVSGDNASVPAGGRTDVVVAVRDRFNNPVSDVALEASTNDTAATLTDTDATTGSDGRATFTVKAGSGVSSSTPVAVNVSYEVTPAVVGADFDGSGPGNTTMTVYAGQGGSGDGSGSAHEYVVDWRDYGVVPGSSVNPATECSAIPCPESFDVASIANPPDPGKVVTYYTNNSTAATLSPTYGSTNISGQHVPSLTVSGQTDVNLSASNTTGADTILLDTVFESTFESGVGVWRSFGTFVGGDPATTATYANRDQQSIAISGGNDGGVVTQPTYDTTAAELVTVEYWARADGPGDGEDLVVEYLKSSGNPNVESDWIEIDRLEGDSGTIFERRARIAAQDASHPAFQLRFRQVAADGAGDEWFVDDVILRTYGPTATSGSGTDQLPTADAGGPYTVDEDNTVALDGSSSTDDGSIQSYSWTITSGPGSLASPNSKTTDYDAPADVSGDQTVLLELTVTDDSGQTDTATTSLTVRDTSAPPTVTVQSPASGDQLAGGSTHTIQWSTTDPDGDLASNSALLEYSTNSGSTWSNIVTGQSTSGSYSWTVPTDDTTTALVRVTVDDQNGNSDTNQSGGTFTVDSTAPTVSSTTITDATDGDGNVTTGDSVTIAATASDSTSGVASVSADASAFGAGTVTLTDGDSDGTFDATVTVGSSTTATEGDQSVTVTTTDGAGNSVVTSTGTLTVDTTAPTISPTSITDATDGDGNVTTGDSVTVTATVSDGESGVESVSADASAFGAGTVPLTDGDDDGTFDATVTVGSSGSVTEGAQSVTVTATDGAGLSASATTGTLTVDTTAPTISSTSITDATDGDGTVSAGDSVTVTATVSDGESGVASVSADASGFGAGTVSLTDGDSDGTYDATVTVGSSTTATEGAQSVTVTATDGAGLSASATTGTLTVDTTAPTISSFQATNPSGQEIQVSFDSDETLSTIAVDITDSNGNAVTTLTEGDFTANSGTYTATYTTSGTGTYTATLTTATDAAGNDGAGGETETIGVGTSATQTSYVSSTGSAARAGPESRVDFDIENTGSSDVVITDIEVSANGGKLQTLREDNGGSNSAGQHEVYIASSTPGLLEADGTPYYNDGGNSAYQLGTRGTLTEAATLTSGEQAQVSIAYFRNNGGQTKSAAGTQLTVTLYFQDGSSTTFTFTPPGY